MGTGIISRGQNGWSHDADQFVNVANAATYLLWKFTDPSKSIIGIIIAIPCLQARTDRNKYLAAPILQCTDTHLIRTSSGPLYLISPLNIIDRRKANKDPIMNVDNP
jgi:hypothetical protein